MSETMNRTSAKSHLAAGVWSLLFGLLGAIPAGAGDWTSTLLTYGAVGQRLDFGHIAVSQDHRSQGGLSASFDQDFGDIVLGGSFQQGPGAGLAGLSGFDQGQRVDLRAGYDFGRSLGYVTFGELGLERSRSPQRSQIYGFGLRVSVNRVFQMTGELLRRESDAHGQSGVLGGDVLSLQAAFQF